MAKTTVAEKYFGKRCSPPNRFRVLCFWFCVLRSRLDPLLRSAFAARHASAFCVHGLIRFYVLRSRIGTLASTLCVLCFRILRSPLPLTWYLVHLRLDPLLCSQLSAPLLFASLLDSAFLLVLLYSSAFCIYIFRLIPCSSSAFCVLHNYYTCSPLNPLLCSVIADFIGILFCVLRFVFVA